MTHRTASDAQRIWHELQVSQIELEVQNQALAELARQKREVEEGLRRYAGMYEHAPVSYLALGADGCILAANRAAAALFHTPQAGLRGRPFESLLAPEEQAGWRRLLAGLARDAAPAVLEAALFEGLGEGRLRIEACRDGDSGQVRAIVYDVTSWQVRETALRHAFTVMDALAEGVVVCDARAHIQSVNPAFCALTGWPAAQALQQPLRRLRHGSQPHEFYTTLWAQLLAGAPWQGEMMCGRRDGGQFQAAVSLKPLQGVDGQVGSVLCVFSDVTSRRRADTLEHDNLRLRRLSAHLACEKEEERKRVAREIHDELGQNLLALRLDIAQLYARTGASHPHLAQRAATALDNVDATLRSVRTIMNALRPAVLDLGLGPALEWLVADFRRRSGLAAQLRQPPEGALAPFGEQAALVLFRVVQEALANIQQHAHASEVEVALALEGDSIVLTVADNGIGIAPALRERAGHFGMAGIAESVAALQGELALADYVPGQGAHLTVRLPLPVA